MNGLDSLLRGVAMQKRKLTYLLGVAAVGINLLSGCSSVSDGYNSASTWLLGEESANEISAEKPRGKTGRSVTGSDGPAQSTASSGSSLKFDNKAGTVDQVAAKPSGKNSGLSINSEGGEYSDEVIRREGPVAAAPKKSDATEPVVKKAEPVKVEPVATIEAKAAPVVLSPPRTNESVDQIFRRRLEESWRQNVTPDMNGMKFNLGGSNPGPQSGVMPESTSGIVQASYGGGVSRGGALATTISFANGSSKLSSATSSQLKKVAVLQRQYGGVVKVVGYASSRTRDMDPVKHMVANLNISLSRAQSVAKELAKYGVPANMIQIEGAGDNNPVVGDEDMPSLEAANRRVEVYLGS